MFNALSWGIWAYTLCLSGASQEIYSVNEEVGNKVNDYLTLLSSPKPFKCETILPNNPSSEWSEDKQWIRSRRCRDDEKWSNFIFSGKIDASNRLSGAGKFGFGMNGSTPEDRLLFTCLDFPVKFKNDAEITSILGTFVNGTLEGNAKVTLNKKMGFVIANFVRGVPHGFKRTFDDHKILLTAEVVSMNSRIGYHWITYNNNSNYFLDFAHTNETFREQMDNHHSLVFLSSSNKFLAGSYPKYIQFLTDPYAPESLVFDEKSKDCLKTLTWSKSRPFEKEVFSLKNFSLLSELPEQTQFSSESTLTAPKRLLHFRKYLIDNEDKEVFLQRKHLTPVDLEERLPFLRSIRRINDSTYEAVLSGEKVHLSHDEGFFDEEDLFHGPTKLRILSKNITRDPIFNTTILGVWAEFVHGNIKDGCVQVQYADKRFAYVNVVSNTLHGPLIIHGAVTILPVKYIARPYIAETGSSILLYKNGRRERPFWVSMFGLGTLTGMLNETGHVTGDKIAYLYPDMETSYIGRFEDKFMREAYLGDVLSVTFDTTLIPELTFEMSTSEIRPFYYEPPTNSSLGAGPAILDPYDQKRVYLSEAGDFGEGVHVKVDMEVGDIACLYSYHIYYPPDTFAYRDSCTNNASKSDDERRHCAKYALGISFLDATLNVPPEKDLPDMFLPTLGMKLNHKFYGSHASFVDFESPRWGMVSSIGLYYKPIKKGEQLYVDYGYQAPAPFPYDFPWFWEAKAKVDKEISEEKIKEKMKLQKKLSRKKKKKKTQ